MATDGCGGHKAPLTRLDAAILGRVCNGFKPTLATPYTAFPFDRQTLDYHFTINTNTSAGGNIEIIPSAAGLRLFTYGNGDDASGWHAQDLEIFTSSSPYPDQVSD